MSQRELWDNNSIQLPRLLAEIAAIGLTLDQYGALRESMDLKVEEIDELLKRADEEWDSIKERYIYSKGR
jgi:hypothetical protein